MPAASGFERIAVAILALGGQGGGVLADWIIGLAERNGFVAQGTSVPGVAQRTGSTIYYIEMIRRNAHGADRPEPVLAMMPVPGDVDVVIASELMEAGRAMVRGFVSADRTTLIGSTHRVYAISEKSAPGDGAASSERILDAAGRRAARFVGFDMEQAAAASGSVISSVMFGALASSGALPFPAASFEDAIREGGKAVEANLRGFRAGLAGAPKVVDAAAPDRPAGPTTPAGEKLHRRILATLPSPAHTVVVEGVRRLLDYQDHQYAELFLERLAEVQALDDGSDGWRLTRETARHLALWMSYEDTIRVADLKVRQARSSRILGEADLADGQLLTVTEYMHPRVQEVCETLPAGIGRWIERHPAARGLFAGFLSKGRHVETTSVRSFLLLRLLAALRPYRRSTLRYGLEQARINGWLEDIRSYAPEDCGFATEVAMTQRVIKGYGDTFEKGLDRFAKLRAAAQRLQADPLRSTYLGEITRAMLADESASHLSSVLRRT